MIDQDKFTNRGSIIREAWENFSKYLKISLELRPEQRQAVNTLFQGNSVIAVLSTGYGKRLIF